MEKLNVRELREVNGGGPIGRGIGYAGAFAVGCLVYSYLPEWGVESAISLGVKATEDVVIELGKPIPLDKFTPVLEYEVNKIVRFNYEATFAMGFIQFLIIGGGIGNRIGNWLGGNKA